MFKKYSLTFLLIFFLTGCIDLRAPAISYQNADLSFLSFQEIQAKFNFNIKNDNMVPLNGKMDYKLFVNGQELFAGASSAIDVGSQDLSTFALESKINLVKAFGAVSDLIGSISSGKTSVPFELQGKFKTMAGLLPLETPIEAKGELPLPQLPKVDLANISVSNIDLQGATLKIVTKVKNNNAFPINFDNFNYQLNNEGQSLLSGLLEQKTILAANETKNLVWNVKVNFASFDKSLIQQITSGKLQTELQKNFSEIY